MANKNINVSDEMIVDLYWNRNETAIVQTDMKYGKYLFKIANNILNSHLDSEECQNDTYLATWNAIPPHKPISLQAFVTKLVRRIAIDRYRESHRQKRIPSELITSIDELHTGLCDVHISSDQLGQALSDFIRSLPQNKKQIFMSRYYFSDSIAEIARSQHVSESAIYKELGHLRDALKTYLIEMDIYV